MKFLKGEIMRSPYMSRRSFIESIGLAAAAAMVPADDLDK